MIWALSQGKARGSRLLRFHSAAILLISALAVQPAIADEYPLAPGQKVIGEIREHVVQPGEGLNDIARKFDFRSPALAQRTPRGNHFTPTVPPTLSIPTLS